MGKLILQYISKHIAMENNNNVPQEWKAIKVNEPNKDEATDHLAGGGCELLKLSKELSTSTEGKNQIFDYVYLTDHIEATYEIAIDLLSHTVIPSRDNGVINKVLK
jgi:hypothetical protein